MMLDDSAALAFDDVRLLPGESDVPSRKSADVVVETQLARSLTKMKLPFFASPMDTVSGEKMAKSLSDLGAMAVIHRYCSIADQARMVREGGVCAAAVGVSGDFFERAQEVVKAGAAVICVDVAHGHTKMMKDALEKLRKAFPDYHLMAGNVATPEAYFALSQWGADSVRVGIGTGSPCSTTIQTGFGKPLFQSLYDISQARADNLREARYMAWAAAPQAQVIADGGLRTGGDVVKSLAAGADFVMLGSMLAGTDEAPGEIIDRGGKKFKGYRGMASKEAQLEWRGFYSSDEGVATEVPHKGPVANIVASLENSVRTGLSYQGVRSIPELQKDAEFIRVSSAAAIEARPHILER